MLRVPRAPDCEQMTIALILAGTVYTHDQHGFGFLDLISRDVGHHYIIDTQGSTLKRLISVRVERAVLLRSSTRSRSLTRHCSYRIEISFGVRPMAELPLASLHQAGKMVEEMAANNGIEA
jgi:hypothetical protein